MDHHQTRLASASPKADRQEGEAGKALGGATFSAFTLPSTWVYQVKCHYLEPMRGTSRFCPDVRTA